MPPVSVSISNHGEDETDKPGTILVRGPMVAPTDQTYIGYGALFSTTAAAPAYAEVAKVRKAGMTKRIIR